MVKSMVEIYRTHKPGIQLFEDAERALSRWKQRFALALISDGPWRMQKNKVEALQLYDQLNPVVLTAEWGEEFSKPHNRAFEYIQRTTGRQGSECVYVADNVSKDFIAPRRMGWRTVQVRRENGIYADLVPPPEGRAEADVRTLDQIEVSY
jgi:putative hydrolase of the HAD superfamily